MYCDWPVLGRCCFCLPLRRGVLTFGYINILFSAFMIGIYSYAVHNELNYLFLYHGPNTAAVSPELCVVLYCLEVIFNAVLVYGTHTKSIAFIKAYYYFAITTTVAGVVLQIIELIITAPYLGFIFELVIFVFTGLCIQIYLINLVSSLLRKLQVDGPNQYENQLNQIVTGEMKIEPNGIYCNTTVEPIAEQMIL